jgi:VanZ family protein
VIMLVVISGLAYAHGLSLALLALPYADKVLHFVLLGGASFLARKATGDKRIAGVPGGPLAVGMLSVIDECAQAFFPTRTFSLADLAANIAGVVVFALLAGPRKTRGGREAPPSGRRA